MLFRLIIRVRQFYISMFSQYTKADQAFARSYLTIQEMSLFNQLPGFEKKHCVVVGQKMLDASHHYPDFDQRKLVRLGLLHDIGKVMEHNSILTKSFLVIVRFFTPWLYDRIADHGKDHRIGRRFYVHKHHGAVGANLLERLGVGPEILSIIAKHDPRVCPFDEETPLEQKILNEADSTY